jgi:streptomycin 6-kinase
LRKALLGVIVLLDGEVAGQLLLRQRGGQGSQRLLEVALTHLQLQASPSLLLLLLAIRGCGFAAAAVAAADVPLECHHPCVSTEGIQVGT